LAHGATAVLIRDATAALGMREIELEVFANNAAAVAIYTACGFRVQGRRGELLHMARTA
jgi:ribosomal protein S18 acetylase RimI-like enzyme